MPNTDQYPSIDWHSRRPAGLARHPREPLCCPVRGLVGDLCQDLPLPALTDTPTAPAAPPSPYTGVKLAAINLNKPDQGVSLKKFAHDWNAYNLTIQQSLGRFRDFENWEGEAATAVQAAFDQHRDWLRLIARLSTTMAKQASGLEQAHHWAIGQHPTLADITTLEDVLRDPRVPDKNRL